ncbi:hypothetical protein K492DRAFT_127127, partial [Lichtheimia hyalospora FSU 10163]
QKSEETSITYMNRGQSYAIQLNDRHKHEGPITSTVAITFHDPSHRRVANNYWKFWLSQQKTPQAARAIDIDNAQSTGISNIQYPSFDRITFEWNGACGARIHVRFNCLSTDFSRIKGVKGIPLRAQMESRALPSSSASSPVSLEQQQQQQSTWEYNESSFCKIKLFRDKVIIISLSAYVGDDLGRHPMWLMYNQPMPYSVFTETPTSPVIDHPPTSFDFHFNSKHARTITAPSILPSYHYHLDTWFQSSSPVTAAADTPLTATPAGPANTLMDMTGKLAATQQRIPNAEPKRLQLEKPTVDDLKHKLCTLLSLHPNQVADVIWRRKNDTTISPSSTNSTTKRSNNNNTDVLILVDDAVVAQHLLDNAMVTVSWEIKADGMVRLVLEH